MKAVLYTTSACSACEQALDLVLSVDAGHVVLEAIDIADDDLLVERYASLIPVLRIGERELVWPFSTADLVGMIELE